MFSKKFKVNLNETVITDFPKFLNEINELIEEVQTDIKNSDTQKKKKKLKMLKSIADFFNSIT